MRAMVVPEFGGTPEPADMPIPPPPPGGVQIHIEAAGVNPLDRKVVDGLLKDTLTYDFPMIPGIDGAGTVSAVGPDATTFAIGDRVVGAFLAAPIGHGTFAEYVTASEHDVARIPDPLATVQAAALPTAGLAAQGLADAAEFTAGQVVFVNGAAGGVGSFLVQLAAMAGADVLATARPDDADRMLRLGATEVTDYSLAPVGPAIRSAYPDGIDVLIDLVAPPEPHAELTRLVRPGGLSYSTIDSADEDDLRARGVRGGNFRSHGGALELRRLLQRAAVGDVVIPIDALRPLSQAPEAIDMRGARGKTVLVV